jgi:hypothetical protein
VEAAVVDHLQRDLDDPFNQKILAPFTGNEYSPEYNPEVRQHSEGVYEGVSATAIQHQETLGITSKEIRIVEQAALIHDVGKQREDIAMLVKGGKFEGNEGKRHKKIVAEHAGYSADLIRSHFADEPMVVALVELHHQLQKDPSYTHDEEEEILQRLGITGESRKKFDVLHEILEAVDKMDGMTRPRSYRDETDQKKMTPDEVAANIFFDFAAAGKDPETGMDIVQKVLKLKYPTWDFSCKFADSQDVEEDNQGFKRRSGVKVLYRQTI